MLLLIGLLLLLLKLLSYRCGDYLICEGAIECVVELSFFRCCFFKFSELFASFDVFASCNLFTGKLYAGTEVVWRCGVILFF